MVFNTSLHLHMKTKTIQISTSILALFSLVFPAFLNAQISPLKDSMVKVNSISEINYNEVWIGKRKSSTFKKILHFDQNGKNTNYILIEDSLKLKRIMRTVNTLYTVENIYGSFGTETWYGSSDMRITDFTDKGDLNGWYNFNRNGKLSSAQVYIYKDSFLSRIDYYNGKHKLKKYYLYTYTPNKKMKTHALYTSKGKLIQFWDYNCDAAGTPIKTSKDTSKFCTIKSYAGDGTIITTTSTFTSKGVPVKYVDYRNTANQQIKYMIYEGKEEKLTYQTIRTYENGIQTMYYKRTGDGKNLIHSSHILYSTQGFILSQSDSTIKGKKIEATKYQFTYNAKGLPITKMGYRDGVLMYSAYFRYKFYDTRK